MLKEIEPEMKPKEPKHVVEETEAEPYEMPLWAEAARKIGWSEDTIKWMEEWEREHGHENAQQSC